MVQRAILLLGVPRSGSTWLSEVLCKDSAIERIHEPDNEMSSFIGLIGKCKKERFPFVSPDNEDSALWSLFDTAFYKKYAQAGSKINHLAYQISGLTPAKLQENLKEKGTALESTPFTASLLRPFFSGSRSQQRRLIKSVHAVLLLPYLHQNFDIQTLLLMRHPLNVFSSYIKMDMPDRDRGVYLNKELLTHYKISLNLPSLNNKNINAGLQLGLFNRIQRIEAARNKNIYTVEYETLIQDPFNGVEEICRNFQLHYSDNMKQFMESRFKKGSGYNTMRVPSEQKEVWKKRLQQDQIDDFLIGYELGRGEIDFTL